MPRWLLEFLAPRKLEGKKKSNIYRMLRLISWNGGIWSEEVENPRSPPLSPRQPSLFLHPAFFVVEVKSFELNGSDKAE